MTAPRFSNTPRRNPNRPHPNPNSSPRPYDHDWDMHPNPVMNVIGIDPSTGYLSRRVAVRHETIAYDNGVASNQDEHRHEWLCHGDWDPGACSPDWIPADEWREQYRPPITVEELARCLALELESEPPNYHNASRYVNRIAELLEDRD